MPKTFLFIDGENFLHKVEEVLEARKISEAKIDLARINLKELFGKRLSDYKLSKMFFYGARLHENKETLKKSKELVNFQRRLRTNLEKQGFTFIMAGNVRGQTVTINGHKKVIFREKGVDVKIAVDLVSLACGKEIDTAILCSSDSDLQPAVTELKKRKVKIVYLGFEIKPNKGLIYTTDKTVLLKNSDIVDVCPRV
ncbi:MAG TPA: NYN domain-containing protein [Patescibacteria group bacterium]|nr:NYN domain-containing protein [Patescibacteria group bacterium]